ncbi:NADPH-dependent FMN reductase [Microbacterium sp. E-13]|uniref:NADPH-dependent FMN reductase n=1 Tax=Microbacterium sp. E-13 TaxID=3404048 RepID=UPI003CEB1200
MSSIVVLVGNPQPASRTRLVAEELARQLAARGGAEVEVEATIDLADVAGSLFRFPDLVVDALLERVARADVLVVASPTYKATYTGLLKAFLDRYGSHGLAGVTAVPLLTIGGPGHALAVEHGLRPLLVELGASTPTRGLAFPAGETERREEIVSAFLETEWSRLAPALGAPAEPVRAG